MAIPDFSLPIVICLFLVAGAVITYAGSKLAAIADRLADRTGMGEAMTGALLLGASTSLPGITTSVTAAWNGHAEFAISNAIGGIAAQTAFLAIADFFNREANLEHQAASVPNILNGAVLMALLGGVLLAADSPNVTFAGIHPATPLLFVAYVFGLHLARKSHQHPQWKPRQTRFTVEDEPEDDDDDTSLTSMWTNFLILAAVMGVSGWVVAMTGMEIARSTGLAESLVGGLFTAVVTSMPELVTTVAAVRRGALTLAVGDIIGGNAFDVMFAVVADIAYRDGSIYHAISGQARFLVALAMVMGAILVAGLVSREKRGIANIGFESFGILTLYLAGFLIISLG